MGGAERLRPLRPESFLARRLSAIKKEGLGFPSPSTGYVVRYLFNFFEEVSIDMQNGGNAYQDIYCFHDYTGTEDSTKQVNTEYAHQA